MINQKIEAAEGSKIPFLNLSPELSWGTKFKKLTEYYRDRGSLVQAIDDRIQKLIEIKDTWNDLEFRAFLQFGRFLKKLNRVTLINPKAASFEDGLIGEFVGNYNLLVQVLGEPTFKKGMSLEQLKNINEKDLASNRVGINTLPDFEWKTSTTKISLRYFDHWGVGFEIVLTPL